MLLQAPDSRGAWAGAPGSHQVLPLHADERSPGRRRRGRGRVAGRQPSALHQPPCAATPATQPCRSHCCRAAATNPCRVHAAPVSCFGRISCCQCQTKYNFQPRESNALDWKLGDKKHLSNIKNIKWVIFCVCALRTKCLISTALLINDLFEEAWPWTWILI